MDCNDINDQSSFQPPTQPTQPTQTSPPLPIESIPSPKIPCPRVFNRTLHYVKRLLAHKRNKPFKCAHCPRRFSQKVNRTKHIRSIHTHEKPYGCDQCTRSFANKSNLNSHRKERHAKEKRFECKVCHKRLTRKYNLDRHMVSTHPANEMQNECDAMPCNSKSTNKESSLDSMAPIEFDATKIQNPAHTKTEPNVDDATPNVALQKPTKQKDMPHTSHCVNVNVKMDEIEDSMDVKTVIDDVTTINMRQQQLPEPTKPRTDADTRAEETNVLLLLLPKLNTIKSNDAPMHINHQTIDDENDDDDDDEKTHSPSQQTKVEIDYNVVGGEEDWPLRDHDENTRSPSHQSEFEIDYNVVGDE